MVLYIEYERSLVPDGGADVCCSFALAKHVNKDAAGHIFHHFALLQAGVIGAFRLQPSFAQSASRWRSRRLRPKCCQNSQAFRLKHPVQSLSIIVPLQMMRSPCRLHMYSC